MEGLSCRSSRSTACSITRWVTSLQPSSASRAASSSARAWARVLVGFQLLAPAAPLSPAVPDAAGPACSLQRSGSFLQQRHVSTAGGQGDRALQPAEQRPPASRPAPGGPAPITAASVPARTQATASTPPPSAPTEARRTPDISTFLQLCQSRQLLES